jgi:putative membrane protein
LSVEPGAAPVPTQQELALERTRIAHERTLMAWIRTSMSMVSFGFTINELFGFLGQMSGSSAAAAAGPKTLGLGLVALGTVALIAASFQHIADLRHLNEPGRPPQRSLALIVAALMSIGSVVIFVGVAFNTFLF